MAFQLLPSTLSMRDSFPLEPSHHAMKSWLQLQTTFCASSSDVAYRMNASFLGVSLNEDIKSRKFSLLSGTFCIFIPSKESF